MLRKGIRRHQSGDITGAAQVYAEILRCDEGNPDAWHLTGLVAFQQAQHSDAEVCIRKALQLRPAQADFQSNLASVCLALNRQHEAEEICRDVLDRHPNHAGAQRRLGNALFRQRRFREAEQALRRAVKSLPQDAGTLCNLGAALVELREFDEAHGILAEALRLNPNSLQCILNQGVAARETGQLEQALVLINRAIEIDPAIPECYVNRGNIFMDTGDIADALKDFQHAVTLNPRSALALNGFGRCLQTLGHGEQAYEAFELACTLDKPDLRFHSNRLFNATLLPQLTRDQLFQLHADWGSRTEEQVDVRTTPSTPRSSDVITIGYLSPDFHNHATMRFVLPILRNHNHASFRVICYSQSAKSDAVSTQIKGLVDGWRYTGNLSNDDLVRIMHQDQVDIAVDLAGHTAGNRLRALAMRPAPVQVSFLGYPHSTGLSRIDYFLTDDVRESATTEKYFSEKVVYLPSGACCFQAPEDAPQVSPSPHLKNGYPTFGSTHRLEKISTDCLQLWSRVLKAVPGSRLFVFRDVLKSASVRDQLRQRLTAAGIPEGQVDLGWEMGDCHLSVYDRIDILLDVFPWGSGTTAYESMWMGVPIPTILGDRGGCRATASMMHQCGLAELVADSTDQYAALVVALAADSHRLCRHREQFRQTMERTVCDGRRFTVELEDAFRSMWASASGQFGGQNAAEIVQEPLS